MNATVSVICYKSRPQKNGEYPLTLRITKNGQRKYQYLGISVELKHWDFQKNRPKPNCPNKELINKIILEKEKEYQEKILEFNSEQKEYTAASLVENKQKKLQLKTVKEFYEQLIKEFEETNKVGNRLIYKTSFNSLKAFTRSDLNFYFSDINTDWLYNYEKWQRRKGNKETTISLQFRTLRSAYNKAIEEKAATKKNYPFDDYKVGKFKTKTKKRAISKDEVMQVITTETINATPLRILARDIFTFSYLCGGIPFVDISNLTMKNIQRGRILYTRQKTHGDINIKLCDQAKEIIKKYAFHQKTANYLFPILNANIHKTELQKQNRRHKVLAQVNNELKELATELEIESKLTTYVARHSFASVLKKSGVSVALISEALGHTDLKTTQIYLDSFENTQIDAAMQNLL